MKMQKGFTLVEVMIVVVIVAILSAIAIPSYNDYVVRGKLTEATAALSNGRIKMEQFFQDNRSYQGGTCPSASANFSFACNTPTATTYLITATGTSPQVTGFSFTINQDNTKTSTTPWGNGATCWITRKGTSC